MTGDLLGFPHVWEPGTEADAPVLLLLHGTGGDEHDLLALGRALAADAPLLSPRGKVLEGPMPRWFRRLAEGVFDEDDLIARSRELVSFVDAASQQYGFPRDKVVAVGFSNGANIAAAALLLDPGAFRGAVVLSPMVPLRPDPLPDLSGAAVLIGAGRSDPIAPSEQAEELAGLLVDAGASVDMTWHPGGHAVTPDEVRAAQAWLARLRTTIGSRPVRGGTG
ncbi:MAG: alpha/beta hydrolase [Actinomycetota bacterium]|nr:alpha/beta hydrolase [Actinomycetota bacterium]